MSSKKSGERNTAAVTFEIKTLAIFGDRENGRESENALFTVNGESFMSMEPVSRQHAAEINHEMTALRTALGAGQRHRATAEESAAAVNPSAEAPRPQPENPMSIITASETEPLIEGWKSRVRAQGYKPKTKTHTKLELEFFVGVMTTLRALGRSYPPAWELILMSGRSLSATLSPESPSQPATTGKE